MGGLNSGIAGTHYPLGIRDWRANLTGWLAAAGRVTFLLLFVTVRALITPPNITDRLAHEAAAIKAIQTIHTMQVQYYSEYGRFATSLTELGPPTSGAANVSSADLIDSSLAAGEKSGYKFTMTANQSGYAISAVPVVYGDTGRRTFYSDETMAITRTMAPNRQTPGVNQCSDSILLHHGRTWIYWTHADCRRLSARRAYSKDCFRHGPLTLLFFDLQLDE